MKRLVITSEVIEIKHFNKKLKYVKWEGFNNAYIMINYMSRYINLEVGATDKSCISSHIRSNKIIEFNITKNRLYIMKKLCSNEDLKMKLEKNKLLTFNQKIGPK